MVLCQRLHGEITGCVNWRRVAWKAAEICHKAKCQLPHSGVGLQAYEVSSLDLRCLCETAQLQTPSARWETGLGGDVLQHRARCGPDSHIASPELTNGKAGIGGCVPLVLEEPHALPLQFTQILTQFSHLSNVTPNAHLSVLLQGVSGMACVKGLPIPWHE